MAMPWNSIRGVLKHSISGSHPSESTVAFVANRWPLTISAQITASSPALETDGVHGFTWHAEGECILERGNGRVAANPKDADYWGLPILLDPFGGGAIGPDTSGSDPRHHKGYLGPLFYTAGGPQVSHIELKIDTSHWIIEQLTGTDDTGAPRQSYSVREIEVLG